MAASVTHNKDVLKRIMKLVPHRGPALWRRNLRAVIEAILKALVLKIGIEGFDGSEVEGGLYFKTSTAVAGRPVWDVTPGDTAGEYNVAGGVVQGHVIPGISFFPGNGTTYVYIAISETLSNNHGFINSFSYNGASLQTGGVVPADNMLAGGYSIPLLKFVGGVLAERYETTSLGVDVIDDGTSSSNGRMRYYPA